jgi:hypothetical protein
MSEGIRSPSEHPKLRRRSLILIFRPQAPERKRSAWRVLPIFAPPTVRHVPLGKAGLGPLSYNGRDDRGTLAGTKMGNLTAPKFCKRF